MRILATMLTQAHYLVCQYSSLTPAYVRGISRLSIVGPQQCLNRGYATRLTAHDYMLGVMMQLLDWKVIESPQHPEAQVAYHSEPWILIGSHCLTRPTDHLRDFFNVICKAQREANYS